MDINYTTEISLINNKYGKEAFIESNIWHFLPCFLLWY